MFDFGNSNNGQKEAISSANGPVLITAGPGTGKTYTLVQRAIYLIEECGVQPENLFIATFTEKAAKELITRITNELARRNITANVNEMYVGTFHSLCLRILKENLEYTRFWMRLIRSIPYSRISTSSAIFRMLMQFCQIAEHGNNRRLSVGMSIIFRRSWFRRMISNGMLTQQFQRWELF